MPVAAGVVGDLGMATRRVLAARDMAAERRRATALDRIHHLQLLKAHMAAIGLTPSRAVIAENIRDLQSWSSHGRWRYGAGGFSLCRFEQPAELTRGQRLMITAAWKQPALFGRDAVVVRGRSRLAQLLQ